VKLNLVKCNFGTSQIIFLRHVIDADGMHHNIGKVKVVKRYPIPRIATNVQAFSTLTCYYIASF
jgi:hypothetical protein